ncbi:MAG TPA: sulfurtransferase TusA family protein [Dehalococcoidia bacterium]|nr:sulfurtransferase TusA family protein [Dehalococcoidia bacterium]
MAEKQASKTIDIKGLICPYTLIETRDTLKTLEQGQVLEVISDYEPAAKTTIPSFCEKKGYPLEIVEDGAGTWQLFITKSD